MHPMGTPPHLVTQRERRRLAPELGALLRDARCARGMTRAALAAAVGVSWPYIGRLERGERCPSTVVAERLIKVLELRHDAADAIWFAAATDTGLARGRAS